MSEEAKKRAQLLGETLRKVLVAVGVVHPEASATGPELIAAAEDYLKTPPLRIPISDALLLTMVQAMDADEAAGMGEPSPWRQDLIDQYILENGEAAWNEWRDERLTVMRAAARAIGLVA